MRDRGVATRYARALVDSAKAEGTLADVGESYAAVVEFVREHPQFVSFIEGPQVAEREKTGLIRSIFEGRIEKLLLNFFFLLIDRNRVDHLGEIGEEFVRQVEKEQGFRRAEVTTAIVLPADLEQALTERLKALTGSQIILEKKVDPAVIGGVLVTLGDEILDGTARTHLAGLKSALLGAPLR